MIGDIVFLETFLEFGFGLVPSGDLADIFVERTGRKLDVIFEIEHLVDLIEDLQKLSDFFADLIEGQEDMGIILSEAADTEESV